MSDTIPTAYSAALKFLERTGPRPIHTVAALHDDRSEVVDGSALLAHLRSAGPEDSLRQEFALQLAAWDRVETDAAWTAGTEHNSSERREAILDALGINPETAGLFAELFPPALSRGPVVIAEDWRPWRTPERRYHRSFYWPHYKQYLREVRKLHPDAINDLEEATEQVMRGITDPTQEEVYQSKGLVIGYVQSGKTANFTGVLAKAIDAGYRLLIVLTGTTNMLRAQTQRRVDMELNGRESLEREISKEAADDHDYHDDPEWIADRFIRHGIRPSDAGYPDIHRLSTHRKDFTRLGTGISALDFERRDRSRPFYDPVNLYPSAARIIVAKKNATVLSNLVKDLAKIQANLAEIPALLIDDESDQASINTSNPKKWKEDRKERTAINRLISQLLGKLPRAQYIGYTATPYANVFIDPADVEDIFPRNFLISLDRPLGYMGADDFHDFDNEVPYKQRTPGNSNEKAHVRFLPEDADGADLRRAIDLFVLTAAVKVHRERVGAGTYRHHTMLVHEAMHRAVHTITAETVRTLWDTAGYYTAAGMGRLRRAYEEDILPVSREVAPALPTPNFEDLRADIGAALVKITPGDADQYPVIVVNSDKDLERQQEALDFDKRPVWRILIGGNKLARGFTVEGLTVSYYRRSAGQVDTLLQMGRWFGFRPGYRDLVRLYIPWGLHDKFAAACQDEEYLRGQLRQYAVTLPDGRPQLTPREVPPLIAQHRPDLKPTQTNKMWNAQLTERRSPGKAIEVTVYPQKVEPTRRNTELWLPIMSGATHSVQFLGESLGKRDPKTNQRAATAVRPYPASVGEVDHATLLATLGSLRWEREEAFTPDLNWLKSLTDEQVDQWVVVMPAGGKPRRISGQGPFGIVVRARTGTGSITAISEHRHRNAVMRISGVDTATSDPAADRFRTGRSGALLLYPSVPLDQVLATNPGPEIDPGLVTVLFYLVAPAAAVPQDRSLLKYVVRDSTRPKDAVVELSG